MQCAKLCSLPCTCGQVGGPHPVTLEIEEREQFMTNFAVTRAQSHFCAVCKICRVKHVPVDWGGGGGGGGSHTVIQNKLNGRN